MAIFDGTLSPDTDKMLTSLDFACSNSHVGACFNIALMYAYGDAGVTENRSKASHYMWAACDLGDRKACDFASKYLPR